MSEANATPKPGERLVAGEMHYSADWLNAGQDAMTALERARRAWAYTHQQLELELEEEVQG